MEVEYSALLSTAFATKDETEALRQWGRRTKIRNTCAWQLDDAWQSFSEPPILETLWRAPEILYWEVLTNARGHAIGVTKLTLRHRPSVTQIYTSRECLQFPNFQALEGTENVCFDTASIFDSKAVSAVSAISIFDENRLSVKVVSGVSNLLGSDGRKAHSEAQAKIAKRRTCASLREKLLKRPIGANPSSANPSSGSRRRPAAP